MMGSVQPPTPTPSRPGVLTKSIVRTPVCKYILHARIRHRDFNDVVFVGEDFIHVKQVIHNGHLEHIATKDDFDCHIKAAKTFDLDADSPDNGEDFIKTESASGKKNDTKFDLPPQLVVLTLDSDDLIFLYLKLDETGHLQFVHQTCPMPTFESRIHQTGDHLAVDPASRALAVAACERQVIIYSAKPTDQIQNQLRQNHPNWCPVSSQRSLVVTGVIQHLEYLHPSDKDPDHIILLLVVVDERRTKALWISWHGNSDLRHALVHQPQPVDAPRTVSNLLIPLRNAAFLTVTGSDMKLHKDILSGFMRSIPMDPYVAETESPGGSPRRPIWTSWCRPLRNRSIKHGQDIIYLIREDGLVILVEVTSIDTMHASNAGNVGCHVGSAFASLGDPSDPDILAIVGDMSNGCVVHMGNWPSPGRIAEMSRVDTMEMQESGTLPNWASNTDMVLSKLPQSHTRSARTTDAVFATSSREPHGNITELRKGIEARLATYFDLEGLKSVMGAWALPNVSNASILMLLSTPSSTRVLDIAPSLEELDELSDEATTLELQQRTLTAGIFSNGHLVQVSEASICTCASIAASFEDQSRWDAGADNIVIAASIEPSYDCAVIVKRASDQSELLVFKHRVQHIDGEIDGVEEGLQPLGKPIIFEDEPLCLATTVYQNGIIGVVATVEGNLQLFTLDFGPSIRLALRGSLQIVTDRQSLCDHIMLLHPKDTDTSSSHGLLAVCGLRDGTIVSVEISADSALAFGQTHSVTFGHETVRLQRPASDSEKAYAFSGPDTCILTWDGSSARSLSIQSLWISDKSRPALSQGSITMVSVMPTSDYLSSTDTVGSLANSLAIVSSNEVCFALVDNATTTIPRQIPVTGTPNRLIYAEQQRSFVCASVCTGVRSFPSNMRNAQPEERRQIWPTIDFIPADKDRVSFTFDLQPGERVYALLEWSFHSKGKQYSFIMVGGSYPSRGGTAEKGRIAMLQPTIRNWETVDVREGRSTTFDKPVYALALYDDLTYLACTGTDVLASRFDTDERKWENICAPLKLSGEGTSISVSGPLIYVSSAREGLVTLRLENTPSRDEHGTYSHRLILVAHPPQADSPLSHTVLPLTPDSNIALLSTKHKFLTGLTSPSPDTPGSHRTRLLFEAKLPRSLVRIKQGCTRPLWRPTPKSGVLASELIGLSADGSMTGIALVDEFLWRRLFWLQRVLEWDKSFSPHAPEIETYGVDAELYTGSERRLPIGFANPDGDMPGDEIALFVDDEVSREGDRHVNGDVLARVLEIGGEIRLAAALRRLADREDRIGEWMARHLDTELQAVEGIVGEIRGLLGMWM